jgi:hypothetical protein
MAIKPESKLWHQLRDNTKSTGVVWTRLESWATPGVPDLHGIKDGCGFWLELKVHRLKTLKSINLSPHQVAWQIQYSKQMGNVWNLVSLPSSSSIHIFHGQRAMDLIRKRTKDDPLTPDWSTSAPYDWKGLISHLLSS